MLEQIIQCLPHPAILLSPQGRITVSNSSARDLFGQSINGRGYLSTFRHPELVQAIEKSRQTANAHNTQIQIKSIHDTIMFDVKCDPVEDDGTHIFLQFIDTSVQKQNVQLRRDFVANVSHELKTPLTAMLGFLETLQGPAQDDATARKRFLAIMTDETGRMSRLVDDLLSLSQVERDERVRPIQRIDVVPILASVIEGLAPRAETLGIKIKCDLGGEGFHCLADEDQLRQVFGNLLENGLKYGQSEKGLEVGISRVDKDVRLGTSAVRVDFKDFGAGFDPIHIPRLEERFYRIDEHRARAQGGTGLGLAIVKHILNRHRGRLNIETKPGIGSIFSITIPIS